MLRLKLNIVFFILIISAQLYAQGKIDFSVSLVNNEKIQLSKIYSKGPTLINFWALWCKPCRAEMKALNELYKKYSESGFSIIGINQDTPRSSEKVRSFIESMGIVYMIGLDQNKDLSELFNVQTLPYSALVDTKGNIVYRHIGYLPGDENILEEEIKNLLSRK